MASAHFESGLKVIQMVIGHEVVLLIRRMKNGPFASLLFSLINFSLSTPLLCPQISTYQ